ncbi:MAG: TMEM165/GDT1 family protein [Candidatus Thorarchaeota archaeon]|nr:TMEM165/GDT1 family protein [Candidatus Thorarchaeota archaeon]
MPLQSLLSAIGIVFVTEIADKTMLTTLCLSAQYRRPLVVLLATMLALLLASIIAVVIGTLLALSLPADLILLISAGLFLIMGIHSFVKSIPEEDACRQPTTFLSMISLVLVSELGDKSQLAILALAAQSQFPLFILFGSIAGFFIVNLIGAFAGDRAANRLPIQLINKATGAIFIIFAILIMLNIL